ncbi:HD-GYP domain-containing protein [bacterium]|nr:HD-GYP domain-containing protein [bacterium]
MALYHELRGEYDDALKCLREHSKLTEALFAEELAEKISEMQVKYETAQLEDQVAEKTAELQRNMEKLRRILAGTIRALAATVETRDPYTAGHQQRVSKLACAIAKGMGFPEERVEGVRLAGIIHDIGKISVPAEILNTPRPLTETEYSLVKMHPKIGHDILAGIDFSAPVADIVLQHHERMDGSGYPTGLKGDEILLEARILAVADVVEAMVSHRPYRPALGIDRALEEISKNKGTKYDPEVVDVCLTLFTEGGFDFEK